MLKGLLNHVRNFLLFKIRYPWVEYGHNVHVQWSTTFWAPNKKIRLGNNVGIGRYCEINTDITIGSDVLVASHVAFVARDAHTTNIVGTTMFAGPRGDKFEIVIEDDVWCGFGAIILSGVRIGRGAIVGAGAVIHKDVPAYSIVVAPAAYELRSRFTPEQIAQHEAALGRAGVIPRDEVRTRY